MTSETSAERAPADSPLTSPRIDGLLAIALVAAAAFARYRPLSPSSLWLDDSWAAVAYKAHGVVQFSRAVRISPFFLATTAVWLKTVGLTSLRAQLVAFVPGILGPAAVFLAARSMRFGRAGALLAGALIVVAPLHMQYSSHVKQYTFEALLTTIIVRVGWWLLDKPDRRRWTVMTITAIATSLASVAIAPVVAGAYAAGLLAALRRGTARAEAIASMAAYGAVAGLWYLLVVRPSTHPALRAYWRQLGGFWSHHANLGLATGLVETLKHVAHGFSGLAPLVTIWIMAAVVVIAFVRSAERAVLLFVPFVVAVVLAGLQIAPLGARVDIYLYPTFALLVGYACQPLLQRLPVAPVVPIVLLTVLLATTPLPSAYQHEDIRPLVARLETESRSTDSILVYPTGRFALALYTHWPVRIEPDAVDSVPFRPVVVRPRLQQLSGGKALQLMVRDVHRDTTVRRVWFIGSHGIPQSIVAMNKAIEGVGFVRTLELGDHNAWLYEYVRR